MEKNALAKYLYFDFSYHIIFFLKIVFYDLELVVIKLRLKQFKCVPNLDVTKLSLQLNFKSS